MNRHADTPAPDWMSAYQSAFREANGRDAYVVTCGGGWYRIAGGDLISNTRLRKGQIVEMTARLEHRAEGTEKA